MPPTHSPLLFKSTSYPGLNFSYKGDSTVSGSNVKATSSFVLHFNRELDVIPLFSFPLKVDGQSCILAKNFPTFLSLNNSDYIAALHIPEFYV